MINSWPQAIQNHGLTKSQDGKEKYSYLNFAAALLGTRRNRREKRDFAHEPLLHSRHNAKATETADHPVAHCWLRSPAGGAAECRRGCGAPAKRTSTFSGSALLEQRSDFEPRSRMASTSNLHRYMSIPVFR